MSVLPRGSAAAWEGAVSCAVPAVELLMPGSLSEQRWCEAPEAFTPEPRLLPKAGHPAEHPAPEGQGGESTARFC